jgi:hypothetical protein
MAYHLLPQIFPPEQVCPGTSYAQLLAMPPAERNGYALFHGHFYMHLKHFLEPLLYTFTLLRHPFERAISHYRYICGNTSHPLHAAVTAKRDFGAYLRDRETFAPDSLTLALGAEFDPVEALLRAERRGEDHKTADVVLSEETFLQRAGRGHVETAKRVLDDCLFVGLQEEMTKSATLLFDHFGRPFGGAVDRTNEAQAPALALAELAPAVIEDLESLHRHDLEVYAHGKMRFERQWAEFVAARGVSAQAESLG